MPKVSPTLGRQLIDENRADVMATGEPKPHLFHTARGHGAAASTRADQVFTLL